ncbi:hypothetical protein T03_17277 [Trichinella britovi]|uniref:Uncharacterized protein n=1 Tax=Trichinella britovi TaxID=45882 RepID=A0A0V1C8M9_TRIBR|nr:hypothetical protein T03_2340 [Trichinella britovi]KRY52572.1 hypothetical protein T03_17277 [Trichinella britovi]
MPFTKWRAMVVASASGMGNASGHFIAVSAFGLLQRAQYVDAYSLERVTNGLYLHWRACFCLGCFSRGARVTRAAPIFYIFSLLRPVEPLADLLQAFSHPQVSTSRMVMNQVQNLRDACARYHGKHRFLVRSHSRVRTPLVIFIRLRWAHKLLSIRLPSGALSGQLFVLSHFITC